METQKFKSVSIREIVDCALHGKPINVQSRELFDLSDIDVDDGRFIVDEYSDPLEVESFYRHVAEEKFLSHYGKQNLSIPEDDSETNSEPKIERQGVSSVSEKAQGTPDSV